MNAFSITENEFFWKRFSVDGAWVNKSRKVGEIKACSITMIISKETRVKTYQYLIIRKCESTPKVSLFNDSFLILCLCNLETPLLP